MHAVDAGGLVAGMIRIGRSAAADAGGDAPDEPAVLADRPDGVVVRVGGVVVKAHPGGTDEAALRRRLGIAASPSLRGIMIPPHDVPAERLDGRLITVWPAGEPVGQTDPDAVPWEQAAALLARLHAVPARGHGGPVPAAGGPARVARAMGRLRVVPDSPAAADVRAAFAVLPPHAQGVPGVQSAPPARGGSGLVHGDWHLGQLVRLRGDWCLIDVDDLGTGDPAWDLARPAAWFAAGVLPPDVWWRFLSAYRAAGGPAVPPDGDPWPRLDVSARALTVQTAALGLVAADREGRPLDEAEEAFVAACRRVTRTGGTPDVPA